MPDPQAKTRDIRDEKPSELSCDRCGTVRPLDRFKRDSGKPLGVRRTCKLCDRVLCRAYREREREKVLSRLRSKWTTEKYRLRSRHRAKEPGQIARQAVR